MDLVLAAVTALLAIGTIHYARQAQAAAKQAATSYATMRAEANQQDTGTRCPRCDCPDGHTQCQHCKTCPHTRPQPKENSA